MKHRSEMTNEEWDALTDEDKRAYNLEHGKAAKRAEEAKAAGNEAKSLDQVNREIRDYPPLTGNENDLQKKLHEGNLKALENKRDIIVKGITSAEKTRGEPAPIGEPVVAISPTGEQIHDAALKVAELVRTIDTLDTKVADLETSLDGVGQRLDLITDHVVNLLADLDNEEVEPDKETVTKDDVGEMPKSVTGQDSE